MMKERGIKLRIWLYLESLLLVNVLFKCVCLNISNTKLIFIVNTNTGLYYRIYSMQLKADGLYCFQNIFRGMFPKNLENFDVLSKALRDFIRLEVNILLFFY